MYSNEELAELLNKRSKYVQAVIDVYHGLLQVALKRELISKRDFEKYFRNAKTAIRSEEEIRKDEFLEFIGENDPGLSQ